MIFSEKPVKLTGRGASPAKTGGGRERVVEVPYRLQSLCSNAPAARRRRNSSRGRGIISRKQQRRVFINFLCPRCCDPRPREKARARCGGEKTACGFFRVEFALGQILKIAVRFLCAGKRADTRKNAHSVGIFVELSVSAYRFVCCLGAFACESAVENNKQKTRDPPRGVSGASSIQAKQRTGQQARASPPFALCIRVSCPCLRRSAQRPAAAREREKRVVRREPPPRYCSSARLSLVKGGSPFISTLDKLDYPKESKPAQAELSAWACFPLLVET